MALTLILGNQLFPDWSQPSPLRLGPKDAVVMIEDRGIASRFRYHKLRLIHTFTAMREFRDSLRSAGIQVTYHEVTEPGDFYSKLLKALGPKAKLRVAEVPDRSFETELNEFCSRHGIDLEVLSSPHFLCPRKEFQSYLGNSKRPFMKTFYERERKRLKVLVDRDGEPEGGKWSFDEENRKKLPKSYVEPPLPELNPSTHEAVVRSQVLALFKDHPGEAGVLPLPADRTGAERWLDHFLKHRFSEFGPYEDALSPRFSTLNHSLLAPLINLGLLNPGEVVNAALAFAKKSKTPISSLEGFIRQIIGWREFVHGIDRGFGARQSELNFFNHHRKLGTAWYQGNTGIPPLDDAIHRVMERGWLHHIERLMVVSNLMLLCEIHPGEVYRWFMELHLDSYEWVMGPNVYGMGQMSDGGIFATKPYISGSNYILKMSDYPKGPWCEIWDGLYWSFIERHRKFFAGNPRLSMMVKLLDRIPEERKKRLFKQAAEFKERVSHS